MGIFWWVRRSRQDIHTKCVRKMYCGQGFMENDAGKQVRPPESGGIFEVRRVQHRATPAPGDIRGQLEAGFKARRMLRAAESQLKAWVLYTVLRVLCSLIHCRSRSKFHCAHCTRTPKQGGCPTIALSRLQNKTW